MSKRIRQRVEDSRRLELRVNELRPVMNMSYKDPLYIDPELVPDGWEYFWVRESVLGEPDFGRTVEMKRKGWTPVPADRHPEMTFDDFLGRMSHLKGYIFHKGLVLFERPKEFGDMERKAIQQHNEQILRSMPGTENFMAEPTIPARFLVDPAPKRGFT